MTKSLGIYERHGGRRTRVYAIWCCMRARCSNPNNPAYANYGGRGILVCSRWQKFSNFLADMGEPAAGMSLERKDNNNGYSKENCTWADRFSQGRNKRNNVLLTIDGETLPLSSWAERYGLKYGTVHQRIRQGWPAEAAVKTPLVKERKGVPRGQRHFGTERGVKFREFEAVA